MTVPRWTASISVSTHESGYLDNVKAVKYQSNIIILQEIQDNLTSLGKIKLSIFNTETHELKKIPWDSPYLNDSGITAAVTHNDQLYIWTQSQFVKLYKLDLKTLEWAYLLTVEVDEIYEDVFVMGNIMHALDKHSYRQKEIIMIDLESNKRIGNDEDDENEEEENEQYDEDDENDLEEDDGELDYYSRFLHHDVADMPQKLCFFENNGQIYKTYCTASHRKVYKYENNTWILMKKDKVCSELPYELIVVTNSSDGTMIFESSTTPPHVFLDTFNFELCQWERKEIEAGLYDAYDILQSTVEVDGVIHLFIRCHIPEPKNMEEWCQRKYYVPYSKGYEVRMLDMNPKLSTICLLGIVDRLMGNMNKDEIEQTRKKLCLKSREKLNNMINWKIADKEVQQQEDFVKGMNEELRSMRDDGLITRSQAKRIRFEFNDSDVSDLTDSDESSKSETEIESDHCSVDDFSGYQYDW